MALAPEAGIRPEDLKDLRRPGFLDRIFSNKPQVYMEYMDSIIFEVSRFGNGVIVGHGSQMLLQDFGCALHVRIQAEEAARIQYVMEKRGLRKEANRKTIIEKKEKMLNQIATEHSTVSSPWCMNHEGKVFSYEESLALIRDFHGHPAPGLVLGTKMVSMAMQQMAENVLFDVICETRSCLPDAVQILTLCTVGNGWLKIKDIGRFALTLYDKFEGDGVRVFLDSQKLKKWPEFYDWFYKNKPKEEQDFDLLMREIRDAGDTVLSLNSIRIQPQQLVKKNKGKIRTCPQCGEAYPGKLGDKCGGCRGEMPYEMVDAFKRSDGDRRPALKAIPTEEAVGKRLIHDMTRIIPGKEKGPLFRKGQVVSAGDICRLQKMGRQKVYVEDDNSDQSGWIHEDEAAVAFAAGIAGPGVSFCEPPREGKVKFEAKHDGLLWVDHERLGAFNRVEGVMCATRKSYTVINKKESLAASRAIPLFLPERDFQTALSLLADGPLLKVLPIRTAKVGILVTGNEIFRGLIKDSFIPIIRSKVEHYGCEVVESIITPDDRDEISAGVRKLLDAGIDFLVTTAGLSVDPDDVTMQGLMDAGCQDVVYGAPILPGAMTLIAKIGEVQVIGVPACGLYHTVTSFDLLVPRLLAGLNITRDNLAPIGHGGFCMDCNMCIFPKCSYGR